MGRDSRTGANYVCGFLAAAAALLTIGSAHAATVERSVFGTAADGQTVELITLRNARGMTMAPALPASPASAW